MKQLKCEFCGELMEWNKAHLCKKESFDKMLIFKKMLRVNLNGIKPYDMSKKEWQDYRDWANKQIRLINKKLKKLK